MLVAAVLTVFCLVLSLKISKWVKTKLTQRILVNKIPGPPSYPIIGSVYYLFGSPENLWKQLRILAKNYPRINRLWMVYVPAVSLYDPEDVEIVLSSMTHIRKATLYSLLLPWLGTGLLTSTGTKWHQRRKILTPAFHFNILQQFIGVFAKESELVSKLLDGECEKPYTDILPLITEFSLKSVCETAMGIPINNANDDSQQYTTAIDKMGDILVTRLTQIWHFHEKMLLLFPLYWKQKKLLRTLHTFSARVINKRIASLKQRDLNYHNRETFMPKARLAMLDLLIYAKNSGQPIDDKGIQEEVDTFIFEGHDTTTSGICFTLMLLACHSDIQEKAVQELQEIFGDSNRAPTFQDMQKLYYLELIIKESLRLYPSVPLIGRITGDDIRTASGYTIPANTDILIHVYDIHHNPDLYPDPEKFDPDRFLPENSQHRHPFAYIPFSGGPRNCIGQKFAMLEMKVIISTILRNYVLKPVDYPESITFSAHLILRTKEGIKIHFRKR